MINFIYKNKLKEIIKKESFIDDRIRKNKNDIIYFIKSHDKLEKEILYNFFKTIRLKVEEGCGDTHENMWLADIIIKKNNSICVSYYLWHLFISNEIRDINSHSYNEFKDILKKNTYLYRRFIKVENNIRRKYYMDKDFLYEVAKHIVESGKPSTNDISKTFNLGFSEAQEVFKELVKLGIIHESVTIEREILVDNNELKTIFSK